MLAALPTLRDLCRSLGDDFAPVAPSVAPSVEVSAVHVSELPDPAAYLDGGELLLTTGLGFRPAAVWYSAYVERRAVAALDDVAVGELADLGLPGGLAYEGTPLDTPQLRAWAERRLAPLGIGADDATLVDTVTAYLRSCSEQAAARELGVHRHTVRNRLARAETCSARGSMTRMSAPSCGSPCGLRAAADPVPASSAGFVPGLG